MKYDIKVESRSTITQMDGVATLNVILDVNHLEAESDEHYKDIRLKAKGMVSNAFNRFWNDTIFSEDEIVYKEHIKLKEE
tara:strand:- start:4455 stop:4694 length:240 start_codon:yes stop_codon:yes gene_type:complete